MSKALPNVSDIKLIRTDTTLDLIFDRITKGLITATVQWSPNLVISPHPGGGQLLVTQTDRDHEPLPMP